MRRGTPATIRIVKVGTLTCDVSEMSGALNQQIKADLGVGGGSTATLIEAGKRILVDTGFDYEHLDTPRNNRTNARMLRTSLRSLDMKPDDIDILFITHWHRDHFGNLGLFERAARLASSRVVESVHPQGFTGVDDGEEIADGVRVVFTPGHTRDHASVVVETRLGGVSARVSIAGDAIISNSYLRSGKVWRYNSDFYDAAAARESVRLLTDVADVIVPGHGVPFLVNRRC